MSATVSNVTRATEGSGDEIAAFEADDGSRVQAFAPNLEVSGELLARFVSDATAVSLASVKVTEGRLFQADVLLTTPFPTDRWLMVFNKATAPVNTDPPIWRARVGNGFASIDVGELGLFCALGIQLAVSTTLDTLTLPGAAGAYFQAGYV
jgi:hypothetical protein